MTRAKPQARRPRAPDARPGRTQPTLRRRPPSRSAADDAPIAATEPCAPAAIAFDRCDKRRAYFFSGSLPGGVAGLNGNELNIVFAWFCICSCICTNMFFDCSM